MTHFFLSKQTYPGGISRYRASLCLFGTFCIFLLMATSCNTQQNTNAGDKVPLTLWYKNHSIDDKLLAQVSKRFPNIILHTQKIGKGFDSKFRTALAGQTGVPDMVGLNSNVATYFPDEDQFVDLYTLGAHNIQNKYLNWKWQQGVTPDGKLLAFPMDTGPTALFYRTDIFQQAGLPTNPENVSAHLKTWDDYIQAAQTLQTATNGKSYMISDIGSIFNLELGQKGMRYFEPSNAYIGDQQHIKDAWDLAVKVHQLHLSATISSTSTDWSAATSNGTIAAFVGAVWMKNYLEDSAPDTAGHWRVARAPGGDGNDGGSFLAVTKYSQHPREAYAVIAWLMSPIHQLQSYHAVNLFPSTPGVYTNTQMLQPEAFFGNQNTTEIFAQSAQHVKPSYFGPNYDIVNGVFQQQLQMIDTQNADPQSAWNAVQQEVRHELSH